ncbi:hypothetical protein WJX84_000469 [Apatococcus fuscideae]|uniref:Uncharacterized protein n=1 Tax=Apatococcus fuscideae TaxID=2026836 RepID=A0AAW1T0J4_9CHLO
MATTLGTAGTTPGPVFPTSAIRLGIPAEDDTLKAHVGGPFGALLSRAVKDSAETRWTSRQQSRPKATVHIASAAVGFPRPPLQFAAAGDTALHLIIKELDHNAEASHDDADTDPEADVDEPQVEFTPTEGDPVKELLCIDVRGRRCTELRQGPDELGPMSVAHPFQCPAGSFLLAAMSRRNVFNTYTTQLLLYKLKEPHEEIRSEAALELH